MTTLRLLPLRLLRAVTAVAAAVLMLLGAVTLQTNTAHTDTPVAALTSTLTDAPQVEPSTVHLDSHDGTAGIFCALLGLAALVITVAITLALTCRTVPGGQALFTLARALAQRRPRRVFERWSAVSLTRLAIARI